MGWFSGRSTRKKEEPSARVVPQPIAPRSNELHYLGGSETLEVVGESHYQEALWSIVGGRQEDRVRQESVAVLMAEANNPFDDEAVSVWINGSLVGYLARADAEEYRPGLLDLQEKLG